ncbi:MAG TPA: hypothetical protein VLM84_09725 [Chromatiaceae bacterium]|nr:hypothetical protein [Chromatiaceae bacterium]
MTKMGYELLPDLGEVHRSPIAQRLEPSAIAWQRNAELAGGGSATLTGVHGFDLVRWFTGATLAQVYARLRRLPDHRMENLFDACFEYADRPLLAACEVSKVSGSRSTLLDLGGDPEAVLGGLPGGVWSGSRGGAGARWQNSGTSRPSGRP